jgi:hypothetical protein
MVALSFVLKFRANRLIFTLFSIRVVIAVCVGGIAKALQLLQSCERCIGRFFRPGFQSKPLAGIGQRFQRYLRDCEIFR